MKNLLLLSMILIISGCASFGEGVTTAILKKQEKEDLRECRIDGKSFGGLQANFTESNHSVKLLMVHIFQIIAHSFRKNYLKNLA